MKRYSVVALILLIGLMAHPAYADQAEAKEVARNNNCAPKKIDVFQQSMGPEGQTIYRVQCNVPKTADPASAGPDELLVGCRDTLCEMLRPYQEPKK